jgi:hypothetical protein
MPRFLRLWLYARAFVTRYPGFLRLRGSPVFSLALYGMIQTGFIMLRFYTARSIFAIPPIRTKPFDMPFKERLKSGQPRKRPKPGYVPQNWSEYNQSLRKRGMLSLYLPKGDLRSQLIN